MSASPTDKFQKLGNDSSLVNTPKVTAPRSAAATTLTVDNCNWDTTTGKTFATYRTDTSGKVLSGTQIIWRGVVTSTTSIGSLTRIAGATDTGNAIGDYVELLPASPWGNSLVDGLLTSFDQDGTLKAAAVDNAAVVADGILTAGKFASGALVGADGYITTTDTWVYVSATSFKITGVDRTAQFPVGTKIKLTQTTAKYFYVTSASFSTDTTVNITAGTDYTLANAAITSPLYSYATSPQGFPAGFNYTTTWSGFSSAPSVGSGQIFFTVEGRKVTYILNPANVGTSNNVTHTASVPITASASCSVTGHGIITDNSSTSNTPGRWTVGNSATTVALGGSSNNASWTSSGSSLFNAVIIYYI